MFWIDLVRAVGQRCREISGHAGFAPDADRGQPVIRTVLDLDETGWPHRPANELIAFLEGSAGWTKVGLERAYERMTAVAVTVLVMEPGHTTRMS